MFYTLTKFVGGGLLFALVGGWIGWSLRSLRSRRELMLVRAQLIDDDGVEQLQYRLSRHDDVVAERDLLRTRVAGLESATVAPTGTSVSAKRPSDRDAPRSARNASTSDLTLVKGIGPKIAELCAEVGITTWQELARAELTELESMLESAGPRYKFHDPRAWSKQADLLARGRWDEYNELLVELGRRE